MLLQVISVFVKFRKKNLSGTSKDNFLCNSAKERYVWGTSMIVEHVCNIIYAQCMCTLAERVAGSLALDHLF